MAVIACGVLPRAIAGTASWKGADAEEGGHDGGGSDEEEDGEHKGHH